MSNTINTNKIFQEAENFFEKGDAPFVFTVTATGWKIADVFGETSSSDEGLHKLFHLRAARLASLMKEACIASIRWTPNNTAYGNWEAIPA